MASAPGVTQFASPVSQVLGHGDTLTYEPWPEHDEALLLEDSVKLPVQVCYHSLLVLAKSCRIEL